MRIRPRCIAIRHRGMQETERSLKVCAARGIPVECLQRTLIKKCKLVQSEGDVRHNQLIGLY